MFSKDTGMTFRDDKCAYPQVQNGKLLRCTNNLEINQLSIKLIRKGILTNTLVSSKILALLSQ